MGNKITENWISETHFNRAETTADESEILTSLRAAEWMRLKQRLHRACQVMKIRVTSGI